MSRTLQYRGTGLDFSSPSVAQTGHVNQMLNRLAEVNDPIDGLVNSVAIGSLVLTGGSTIVLSTESIAPIHGAIQVIRARLALRAATSFSMTSGESVAFQDAVLSGLVQAGAVLQPAAATIQFEVQLSALAATQIQRQIAMSAAGRLVLTVP